MKQKTFNLLTLLVIFAALFLVVAVRAQGIGSVIPQAGQSLSGIVWPKSDVVFLDTDNSLWFQRACQFGFRKEVTVRGLGGQLIGIDYRPADGLLYGLDDAGILYTIDGQGSATTVSLLTVQFAGDVRSLMDFNPVLSALRLIGANDQNLAVVNSGGNLNLTASQTAIAYATGDVNAGKNPNLVGGAYTNNVNGATKTIFYGIDYAFDTLVTIADLNAAGSSNTGGGRLKTIGTLTANSPVRGVLGGFPRITYDLGATADFDIYTVAGKDFLLGVNGDEVFTVDLAAIQSLPLGQVQSVPVRRFPLFNGTHFIDVAVGPTKSCQ